MSGLSTTVTRTMGEAAAAAARLIEKSVDHAVTELQSAEQQATADQRQQIADAWRELQLRRRTWGERFPRLLQDAFQEEASARPQDVDRVDDEPSSDFHALTLVDDSEIAHKIESSRLAQQLTAMLERPLSELDGLMSSALGLDVVQPERNPLRPVVYARVLRDLMDEDRTEPAWPALWLRHMVKPLAQELEATYRQQSQLLTAAQVHAANYRLVTAPAKAAARAPHGGGPAMLAGAAASGFAGGGGSNGSANGAATGFGAGAGAAAAFRGAAPGSGPTEAAGTAAAAPAAPATSTRPAPMPSAAPAAPENAEAPLPALDASRLRQFLASDEPEAHQPVAVKLREQAEAELRALEERVDTRSYDADAARAHMGVPVVERPPRHVDTDSPLPQELWGEYGEARERSLARARLKTQAREMGQVMGLEVVRQLLDKVAEDPRLLAPVREAIVALEPSLARLAMVAPRFFSDATHPGRLLVERIAERSFKYNDEFSVEFQAFLQPVAQTFTRLNEIERLGNAIPFQAALAALQAGWRAQDALDEEAQRKVLESVQYAERRHQEAERIAAELRERDDVVDAPGPVQEFLLRTWSVVVAQARLGQPQAGSDPGGHLALVPELVWSVHRELPLREPARAFVLIPRLLLKLREGLATLGQDPAESEAFFRELEWLHRPVLKLRAKQRHRELAPPEPCKPLAQPAPPARAPDQPWMPARELDAAGFEDTPPPDFADLPPAQRPTERPAPPLSEREVEEAIAALEPGCWVDIYSRQQWRRAQLAWAADKGTLFMFVSHGGQPHSMTRRILQRLARERLLRAVAGEGVVPRALERLGQPAAS